MCWFAQFALTLLVVHAAQLSWHTLLDKDGASVSNPELWPAPQPATYSCALPAVSDTCRLPRPASPAWLGWMHHRSMGSRSIPNCCRGEFLLTIPQVAWTVSKETGQHLLEQWRTPTMCLLHHRVSDLAWYASALSPLFGRQCICSITCSITVCLLAHCASTLSQCVCSHTLALRLSQHD